ncbi:MAG: mechanosensitive ion channel family protein [Gammaproteobacteria bacterium]|nr:mechanosensitive ion channel family protein [Gammaproteobacteria bacterium]
MNLESVTDILSVEYFGNSLLKWVTASVIAAVAVLVLLTIRGLIRRRYKKLQQTSVVELTEIPLQVASKTTSLFIMIIAVGGAAWTLAMPDRVRSLTQSVMFINLFWQAGLWISTAVMATLERRRRHSGGEDRAVMSSMGIITFIIRVLIWAAVILLTLDNLGIDITALVAGLGIGGIAVALAVQNVLGDVLASLSIALDKPFVVGDFLNVGDYVGSVEYIGIKSTRIRSLTGEQIVIANADLLASRVRNYGRMVERRVVFTLNVTYETPRASLQKIAGMITDIVKAQEKVRFDRCHFAAFGAASLDFETVYYVQSADYNQYMNIQQAINFAILEAFEKEGIEFAYPTQKLWLARAVPPAEAE